MLKAAQFVFPESFNAFTSENLRSALNNSSGKNRFQYAGQHSYYGLRDLLDGHNKNKDAVAELLEHYNRLTLDELFEKLHKQHRKIKRTSLEALLSREKEFVNTNDNLWQYIT